MLRRMGVLGVSCLSIRAKDVPEVCFVLYVEGYEVSVEYQDAQRELSCARSSSG